MSSLDAQFAALETKLNDCVKAVALKTASLSHELVSRPITEPETLAEFGSPVDTGFYQKNNNFAVGRPDNAVTSKGIDDSDIESLGKRMVVGDTLYLTNSVRYAGYLDINPSPLEKTKGGMYYTSARYAVANMNNFFKQQTCQQTASKFRPVKPFVVKVGL